MDVSKPLKNQSIGQEFLESTSIPGVSQFGKQASKVGKVAWIIIFLSGFALSIYQSLGLISDYFEYKTYQQSIIKSNATLPLPAITVCKKNPVKWMTFKESNMKKLFDEKCKDQLSLWDENKGKLTEFMKNYIKEWVLLQFLHESDDETVYFSKNEVLPTVIWSGKRSSETDSIAFKNPYYGTCVTFNPGVGRDVIFVQPGTILYIPLYYDTEEEPDFLFRTPGFVFTIHEPGTPPVLVSSVVHDLAPGASVEISLTLRQFVRLPEPYPSKCIDGTYEHFRERMVYYDKEKFPYLYSLQGCKSTYLQNKTLTDLNFQCLNPTIPFYKKDRKVELCNLLNPKVGNKDVDIKMVDGLCPFKCNEIIYESVFNFVDDTFMDDYWKDFAINKFISAFPALQKSAATITAETLDRHVALIEIRFESSQYEDAEEQAKYTVADFWGAIGGNIGFWTGISILSLLELFNLLSSCFINKTSVANSNKNRVTPYNIKQNRHIHNFGTYVLK